MEMVEITIGGRRFKVQCGPGEGSRLRHLARLVDQNAAALVRHHQGLSEEKLLLLANLLLADQLEDASQELAQLTAELERIGTATRERGSWVIETAARRLDALVARIERSESEG